MISAWFTTSDGTVIPALVPEREILEIANMVGLSEADLFSIEIPSGASRESRVKVLVEQGRLSTLYAGTNATATFWWKESTNATPCKLDVWLLPPKPLWTVAGGAGVMMVEAVDCRYWWRQSQTNVIVNNIHSWMYGSDGRYQIANATGAGTAGLDAFVLDLIFKLHAIAGPSIGMTGFAPNEALQSRVADHVFTPECSIAMTLDLVLASVGWMVQLNPDSTAYGYDLVEINDDSSALATFMAANKVAFGGGVEATSASPTATEPLMALWQADSNYQKNRMPAKATVSFPYRTIEGLTTYSNRITPNVVPSGSAVQFQTKQEFGWELPISTARPRTAIGARTLREPRSLVASLDTTLNASVPGTNILGTSSPSWDYVTYTTQIMQLLAKRCSVIVGQTAWAGWKIMPYGAYRCTMLRYGLGMRDGEIVPFTLTVCDQDDWLLGPSGMVTNNPKELSFGRGLVQARRLGSGVLQIDAAPPNTRVFPAKIVGAETYCDNPWRWRYSFEEVEPNPCSNTCSRIALLGGWGRGNERVSYNMSEEGNQYVALGNVGNVIAPGVKQSDYTNATISALPISIGTVVLMVEQFNRVDTGCQLSPDSYPNYWFSMPNAVKVVCTSP